LRGVREVAKPARSGGDLVRYRTWLPGNCGGGVREVAKPARSGGDLVSCRIRFATEIRSMPRCIVNRRNLCHEMAQLNAVALARNALCANIPTLSK
jgi:hypothetical protein